MATTPKCNKSLTRLFERWHAQVAARIMKRDNYMIAIVRERVIPLAVCGLELPF